MKQSKDIQDELLNISEMLAKLSCRHVYEAPEENYFQSLSDEIMIKINAENETDLTVPQGYFENFANELMNKIKQLDESEENLSDVLNSLRKINVYSVPEGYFEKLESTVVDKVGKNSKIIVLSKRNFIFKYAVAASVTALLGLGIYKLANQSINQKDNALLAIVNAANTINKNNSFEKELSGLPDDVIENYLSEKGDDVNAALVASLTDEQSLPEEEEYLLDENRLDNYLDEFNISKKNN